MNYLKKLWKRVTGYPRAVDVQVNEAIGSAPLYSDNGGYPNQTISGSFGEVEAKELYAQYQAHHKLTFPFIPLRYPMGQFFEDICTAIQTVATGEKCIHGLQSIDWDNVDGKDLQIKYPGIKQVVETYLKQEGVRT